MEWATGLCSEQGGRGGGKRGFGCKKVREEEVALGGAGPLSLRTSKRPGIDDIPLRMGVRLLSWACILSSDSFHSWFSSTLVLLVRPPGCRCRAREGERPKREEDYGRAWRNGVKMPGQGKSGLAGSLE